MDNIVNFNRFKFSRENYYMDIFINKSALYEIEQAIEERLNSIYMSKDEEYAYSKLKSIFEISRMQTDSIYAQVRINKCFIRYIRSLYFYFLNDEQYTPLRVLNEYLQENTLDNRLATFAFLSEDTKIDVLSHI